MLILETTPTSKLFIDFSQAAWVGCFLKQTETSCVNRTEGICPMTNPPSPSPLWKFHFSFIHCFKVLVASNLLGSLELLLHMFYYNGFPGRRNEAVVRPLIHHQCSLIPGSATITFCKMKFWLALTLLPDGEFFSEF